MNFDNPIRNYCEITVYYPSDAVLFNGKVYQPKRCELNRHGVIGISPNDNKHWEQLGWLGEYEVKKMIHKFNQIKS